MKKFVILGVVLSVVIFLPRLIELVPARPGPATPAPTAADGNDLPQGAPGDAEARLAKLEGSVKKMGEFLKAEREARNETIGRLQRAVRDLTVRPQLEALARRVEAKAFAVPAWQVPPAKKLAANDLPKAFKLGVGHVVRAQDDVPAQVVAAVGDMLVSFLFAEKLKNVKLYRETAEDSLPYAEAGAPSGLTLGSPLLDATLQASVGLSPEGLLHVKAVVYRLPSAAVAVEVDKTGADWDALVKAVAQEAALAVPGATAAAAPPAASPSPSPSPDIGPDGAP